MSTVTKLENIMVNSHKEKCPYKKFHGKIPDYAKYLRTFGEMVVVRSIATVKSRLEYQVMTYMFLGYAQNHIGGTYHMLNIRTKIIVLSCDVIWLNKTYCAYISKN